MCRPGVGDLPRGGVDAVTLLIYQGKKRTTYGFRLWYRGVLYKRMVGHSKALAVEAEKRMRASLELASFESAWGPLKPELTPWADAVKRYGEAKAQKTSLRWDQRRLRWWGEFLAGEGVHYVQEITPEHIDRGKQVLFRLNKKPVTVGKYLAVLGSLCTLAVRKWKLLKENPLAQVDLPKVRPVDYRIATPEEIHRLVVVADPILRPLIIAAIYTGLREGDVLRLTAEDFRIKPGWVAGYGSKGGRPVWLPVAPPLRRLVDSLAVVSGRLFRNVNGTPIAKFPYRRWAVCRTAAGVPWLRFHDLRHAVGSMLAEAGVPQRHIQAWLGHSTLRMSERYTRVTDGALLEASKRLTARLTRLEIRTDK